MKRAALACLLALGCASHEPMTELRISAEFPTADIATIVGAADDWCSVSDSTCLPVSVVDRDANVVLLSEHPKWWPEGACGKTLLSSEGSRIEFSPDCVVSPGLARHELGHALATELDHVEGAHLMSATFPEDQCITRYDAEHVCARRGCVVAPLEGSGCYEVGVRQTSDR